MVTKQDSIHPLLVQMFELIKAMFDVFGDSISQKMVERFEYELPDFEELIEASSDRILGALPDFEAQTKKVSYRLDSLEKQLEALASTKEMLANLTETNQKMSTQFFDDRIVMPMVRGLFPVVDLVRAAKEKLAENSQDERSSLNYICALETQLEQFLAGYGIEMFCHDDENFDPKTMKPLKKVFTDDRKQRNSIEKTLQCGFKMGQRVLRLESVSLYEYQKNNSTNLKGATK